MSSRTAERLALEIKLRDGLEERRVRPALPAEDRHPQRGVLVGVEALVRWKSPELGPVQPAQFIPLMEETGLIVEAGRWALRRAIADRRRWTHAGLQAPRIADQRVHRRAAPPGLRGRASRTASGWVTRTTASTSRSPNPSSWKTMAANIAKLLAIRDLGVDIAVDDFGTGYSSLAYLARGCPYRCLKIDRTFVSAMLDDASAMTLVSTMISLGRSLKLTVVAEAWSRKEQGRMPRLPALRSDAGLPVRQAPHLRGNVGAPEIAARWAPGRGGNVSRVGR